MVVCEDDEAPDFDVRAKVLLVGWGYVGGLEVDGVEAAHDEVVDCAHFGGGMEEVIGGELVGGWVRFVGGYIGFGRVMV